MPRAPAELQNNKAAKPKAGAKNPWNVTPEPQATLSATSKRAFLLQAASALHL